MKRKLVVTATAGMLSFALGACGSPKTGSEPAGFSAAPAAESAATVSGVSEAPGVGSTAAALNDGEAYKNKASYKVLADFSAALSSGDYSGMMDIVYFPENSILTEDDLAYSLLRSDYADLIESEISIEDFDASSTSSYAVFRSGQDEVSVRAALEDDNKWHVEIPGIYIEDATILAPAKAQVSLNGVELDKNSARKHSSAQGRVVYTVTIPNRKITGTTETMFGTMEKEMVKRDPEEKEAMYTVCPVPDDALTEEVAEAVRANINALYALYEAGDMEVSNWQPYFSEKVTPEGIESVQASINRIYTWHTIDPTHLEAVQMLPRDNIVWVGAYDAIGINVKMETKMDNSDTSRTFGFFVMQKKEDGTWVFGDQYPIENNFTDSVTNDFTKEW